jgi:tetratricopeptide (TPR) repeat protein/predicted Ser/Thr protein kinase
VADLDPEQRRAFLVEQCAGDAELRAAVEHLLSFDAKAQSAPDFLHSPADDIRAALPTLGTVPAFIGHYRVVRCLGEGGMGTVYEAEQDDPRRTVALKVMRPGFEAPELRKRFTQEARILGWLHHAGIAQVYDAGATADGRLYFAMEFIRGLPLDQHVQRRGLPAPARLELLARVCDAVQHAHEQGVIHRDLKPANVVVDETGQPKVLDFGVAHTTGAGLLGTTAHTRTGQLIGTLGYMSPEQVASDPRAIDAPSDVYALGVILYELLADRLPYRLDDLPIPEVVRVIREVEPSRLGSVNRQFRGEIETIVAKALEKDKARRYPSAGALGEDLRHYLAHEPIRARPASALYKVRKFVSRHRGLVSAAAVVFAALLAATIVSTWQAVRATRAEADALARAAEKQAVLDFVEQQVFAAARPEGQEGGRGYDITLRQAIEAALPFVDKSFRDQPLIEARLRMTLGMSFHYLGEYRTAAEQCEAARSLYARHLDPDHPDILTSMDRLAMSYRELGRLLDALKLREETLALRRGKLGPGHPDTLGSMYSLADSYLVLDRLPEALKLYEETLALQKAKLGPDHPDTLRSMNSLAGTYDQLGRRAEALKLREETLALQQAKLGPDHPDTLRSMSSLASSYADLGRLPEALKLSEETLALQKAKLGPVHPDTLRTMSILAWFLATASDARFRDPPRAVELAAKAAELLPPPANPWGTLGTARYRTGDWKGAIADLEKAIGLRNPDHPHNAHNGFVLAMAYWQLGEKDKARAWFDKSTVRMAKGLQENAELKRFRAEAAQLVGIETKK